MATFSTAPRPSMAGRGRLCPAGTALPCPPLLGRGGAAMSAIPGTATVALAVAAMLWGLLLLASVLLLGAGLGW